MSDIAVEVDHVWKKFHKGEFHDSLRDFLPALAKRIIGRGPRRAELEEDDFWALKDVSFQVKKGEVLGIIGPNGAGKSTLLKVLSRILKPNRGRVQVNGRLRALIEIAAGFHPDLTGRENVYLNGTIMGMKKREIDKKFDEIVDFSGIEEFLDTPVKRYSSGMYARLGFAVAAHLDPEILIVDEVLAVGDYQFQKKCLGKMESVAKEGRTVLFVSHNMQAISTLTERCLVLSSGETAYCGATNDAIREYLRGGADESLTYSGEQSPVDPRITHVELDTTDPNNVQRNEQPMTLRFAVHAPRALKETRFSFQAVNSSGQAVMHLFTYDSNRPMCREPGTYWLTCHIPKVRLYLGRYSLTVYFGGGFRQPQYQQLNGICPFEVVLYEQQSDYQRFAGTCVYTEECDWSVSTEQAEFPRATRS